MDSFKMHRVIYDVTINSMTAGQQLVLDATMSAGGVSYRTPNPVVPTSSNIAGQLVGEIDSIEIISPIPSSGSPAYYGIDVWPVVDGQQYQHLIDVAADAIVLGWPLHSRTYGGSHLAHLLGVPFWQLALKGLGGTTVSSMPTKNTTIKFTQFVALTIQSQQAWTAASGYGLRIILKGYLYTTQDLAYLAPGWQTSIHHQTEVRDVLGQPPLVTTYGLDASALTFKTWQQMPGGVNQQALKVSPYVHYAINAAATTPNNRYVLSNDSTTYGASGHVLTPYQDLGLNGPASGAAALIRHFGVTTVSRPSNIARIGWIVDGTEIPENVNGSFAGLEVTDAVNNYFVGDTGPYLGDNGTGTGFSGLYRPIPHPDGQELLFYKNIAAPFIADNGTAVPAQAIVWQEQGVLLEGVS